MRGKIVLAGLIVAVMVFAMGCTAADYLPEQEQQIAGEKPSSPLGAELFAEDTSLFVGETTKLTLRIFIEPWALGDPNETAYNRVHNITASIELPDGLGYVSGNLSWQGDIEGAEVREISVVAMAKDAGLFKVNGKAVSYWSPSMTFGKISTQKICIVNSQEEVCAEEVTNYDVPELQSVEIEPQPPELPEPPLQPSKK